ncbi:MULTISPECIES: CRISPR-associated protein Cas4 [unclassified Candidatus Frackibacter]|uniref:CRISPR-associated protein Cas4 n=1 Tax=unclassified Candidatus Frackibacter TaxID=2648818 RepID=UPI0008829DA6|nr:MULTISPECIES: CRISPR-associated protein Cas4 [unclassified Candidatus Frackibacter]SDC86193.1 CRISPR-associated exonuclease, Cas4 family [Candidatus Frackibacter sp. WG11]SEN00498.1 CRISPR-associated exonuclease, Cas4 family [Candidatus Frackibacter sp. WG12]SFL55696.1 CRISPR-associated exonuclease, Cas4 family [Candidatus Frackibacter sp. WG13]
MNESISITPSEVIEYMYCPRFIYYMLYLKIPQREERRYKVQLGREIHDKKTKINKDYLRKKIGVKRKLIDQKLSSEKYNIHGIIDEILFLEDETAASLDYKFAKDKGRLYNTHKYQAVMYSMLIADNYDIEVNKAFLVYIRSNNKLKEIKIEQNDFKKVARILKEIIQIIDKGYYPKATSYKRRCRDCCYRNICIK